MNRLDDALGIQALRVNSHGMAPVPFLALVDGEAQYVPVFRVGVLGDTDATKEATDV